MVANYKIAIKIAIVYFVFSLLYITLSDKMLLYMIDDAYTLTVFQTYKGIAFISITSFLLFFLINREIKKEKTFENELVLAKESAEKSDKLKTAFINNMSHEIRTPLNSILGFSEILVSGDLNNEERMQYLNVLNRSGDQLLRIIDDILDISKIESNILTIRKKEFSLEELFDETKLFTNELLRQKGKKHKLDFINLVGKDNDLLVSDRGRLIQILQNLITNAVKFTEEGIIIVSVKYIDDNFISFRIKDTGIGIVKDKIQHIFEPFTQEDYSISRTYGGTGLGLSISKALVQLLGGEIGVNSIKGQGSEFFFTISRR